MLEAAQQSINQAKQAVEQEALTWPEKAKAIVVCDQESYDNAIATIKQIAIIRTNIEQHHAPIKKAAHEAHKAAVAAEKRFLDPLKEAEKTIRNTVATWMAEEERKRQEEQARLEAEQKKKAEEERLKLAEKAEAEGKSEAEVDAILEDEKPITPPVAKSSFVPGTGVSTRMNWFAEVEDIKELCRAVVDGKAPINAVLPNMAVLNQLARDSKDKFDIPGVIANKRPSVAIR